MTLAQSSIQQTGVVGMIIQGVTMEKKWKEITPDFISFEKAGQSIEGELLGYTELRIKDVPVKKWQIKKLSDGIITGFLGGVSLDPMLEAVPIGQTIKLEYAGNVKLGGGYSVKTFKLYIEDTKAEPKPEPKK